MNVRIRCKGCRRYVIDRWEDKLRHAAKHHPEFLLQSLSRYDPNAMAQAGARVGAVFTSYLRGMFYSGRPQ